MLLMEPRPSQLNRGGYFIGQVFLLHFNGGSLCPITKPIFLKLKICHYFLLLIPTQIWELLWCFWQPLRLACPFLSLASLVAQLVNNPSCNVRRPWFDSWVRKICWRRHRLPTPVFLSFPCGSAGKESTCNVGDLGSIPGLGWSPGEGKGYLLQYSGLENSMDCIVDGVTKSRTQLSNFLYINWCFWQLLRPALPFPPRGFSVVSLQVIHVSLSFAQQPWNEKLMDIGSEIRQGGESVLSRCWTEVPSFQSAAPNRSSWVLSKRVLWWDCHTKMVPEVLTWGCISNLQEIRRTMTFNLLLFLINL